MKLGELKKAAFALMSEAGYPILEDINFAVDEKLAIMGYTDTSYEKTRIVVSGWSLNTDMAMGLVIHELSHVYRSEAGHPSHNFRIHNKVVGKFEREEPLRRIINHIQDIYADDIAFPVYMEKHRSEQLPKFFSGWVLAADHDVIVNAERLVSAAFAKANLERHGVSDDEKVVDKAIEKFLKQINKKQQEKFAFFNDTLKNLPEKVSEKEFEKLLSEFIWEFIWLTK